MKEADVMIELLKIIQAAEHLADYILFDACLSYPAYSLAVKDPSLGTIAMIKKVPACLTSKMEKDSP